MKSQRIKRIAMSVFALLWLHHGNAWAQQKDLTINGTFTDPQYAPAKVYLVYPQFLNVPADSAVVDNGKFLLHGALHGEQTLSAILTAGSKSSKPLSLTIFVAKGDINVTVDGGLQKLVAVTGNGAAAQLEFNTMMAKNHEMVAEVNKLLASDEVKKDSLKREEAKKKLWYAIGSGLNDMVVYVRSHPRSPIATSLILQLTASGLVTSAMADTLLHVLPETALNTLSGKEIQRITVQQKEAMAKMAAAKKAEDGKVPVGSVAGDFTQNDVNGKPVSLTSFRGKYVLVDFWASWCAPCRAENPNVVKAYQKYKDKGFTILGVSLDGTSTKAAWLKAIEKDGLTWTQVSDLKGWKNEAALAYGVTAIPQNFLIGPDGRIVGKNLRGEDLNNKLASIFKN